MFHGIYLLLHQGCTRWFGFHGWAKDSHLSLAIKIIQLIKAKPCSEKWNQCNVSLVNIKFSVVQIYCSIKYHEEFIYLFFLNRILCEACITAKTAKSSCFTALNEAQKQKALRGIARNLSFKSAYAVKNRNTTWTIVRAHREIIYFGFVVGQFQLQGLKFTDELSVLRLQASFLLFHGAHSPPELSIFGLPFRPWQTLPCQQLKKEPSPMNKFSLLHTDQAAC